jgi:hypothetical protein
MIDCKRGLFRVELIGGKRKGKGDGVNIIKVHLYMYENSTVKPTKMV